MQLLPVNQNGSICHPWCSIRFGKEWRGKRSGKRRTEKASDVRVLNAYEAMAISCAFCLFVFFCFVFFRAQSNMIMCFDKRGVLGENDDLRKRNQKLL